MADGNLRIRAATADDAGAVAALHVASWQATYRGELPDAYLDGPLAAEKAAHWAAKTAALGPRDVMLVAEAPDTEELLGFIAVWPDPALVDGVLIDNLHAAPSQKRRGVGRALMRAARDRLLALGLTQAWLTVFPDNAPAVAFYRAMGGQPGPMKADEIGGAPCTAQAYYWLDLREMRAD